MLAYLFDDQHRQELNARKMNYWDAYIAENFELLGLCGRALAMGDLDRGGLAPRLYFVLSHKMPA